MTPPPPHHQPVWEEDSSCRCHGLVCLPSLHHRCFPPFSLTATGASYDFPWKTEQELRKDRIVPAQLKWWWRTKNTNLNGLGECVNNCWRGRQNERALGKCTHQQDEKQGERKKQKTQALVCYCFPVFCCIGEYIFLDPFHFYKPVRIRKSDCFVINSASANTIRRSQEQSVSLQTPFI